MDVFRKGHGHGREAVLIGINHLQASCTRGLHRQGSKGGWDMLKERIAEKPTVASAGNTVS